MLVTKNARHSSWGRKERQTSLGRGRTPFRALPGFTDEKVGVCPGSHTLS